LPTATFSSDEVEIVQFADLGDSLCNSYSSQSSIINELKQTVQSKMREVIKDPKFKPTDAEMVAFLNKHKNKLTCGDKAEKRHYLAKAFNERVHMIVFKDLFETDLYKKDEYKIDYNSVTVMYNPSNKEMEPMTILDYIQKVAIKIDHIADSPDDLQNVKNIRGLVSRNFGGKFFTELPQSEQRAFLGEEKYREFANRPVCKLSPAEIEIVMTSSVFPTNMARFDICNYWSTSYQLTEAQRTAIDENVKKRAPINNQRAYTLCKQYYSEPTQCVKP
jgi:hypothetical protein